MVVDLCPTKAAVFVITLCICCQGIFSKKQQELEIITEYKPEDCVETADVGDEVTVHYTGTLDTGAIFDTSRQPTRGPLPFKLGEGRVIKGWEQGIRGMCVGEIRKLVIPSHLAYGEKGHPPVIPPHATLTFDTELVSLEKRSGDVISSDAILDVLRFLAWPAAIGIAIYYVYDRYRKEPTKRDLKEHRGKKAKRH